MSNPKINIDEIKRLEESYLAPDGYFDSLADRIEARKDEKMPLISIEDINSIEESYQVPEGYFEGLMEKIEERKNIEDNVVSFRQRKIRIWGSFVAAACIAMVVVSVINFGPTTQPLIISDGSDVHGLNISDSEIASLLNERDDEFVLTEEEIIEVIEHESVKSESTAIIDFLQEEDDLDGGVTDDDDFLEEI